MKEELKALPYPCGACIFPRPECPTLVCMEYAEWNRRTPAEDDFAPLIHIQGTDEGFGEELLYEGMDVSHMKPSPAEDESR